MIYGRPVGNSKGRKVVIPYFTGEGSITQIDDSKGYIEITSSGTLSFLGDAPDTVDVFLVGGGGQYGPSVSGGSGGPGGGSGFTTTQKGEPYTAPVVITIGAPGTVPNNATQTIAGTTSYGEITAAGGQSGSHPSFSGSKGGNGGSGGGAFGGNGGSNGSNGLGMASAGTGQGTPTTDLLGRIHAPGGGCGSNPGSGSANGVRGYCDLPYGAGGSGGGGGGGAAGAVGGYCMVRWGDWSAEDAALEGSV